MKAAQTTRKATPFLIAVLLAVVVACIAAITFAFSAFANNGSESDTEEVLIIEPTVGDAPDDAEVAAEIAAEDALPEEAEPAADEEIVYVGDDAAVLDAPDEDIAVADEPVAADEPVPGDEPAPAAEPEEAEPAPADEPVADEPVEEYEEVAEPAAADEPAALVEQTVNATIYGDDSEIDLLSVPSDSIILTGMLPEGATVSAYPVEISIDGITVLAAYDITITDAEGNEFQPTDSPLLVSIATSAIADALNDEADLVVYHLEDAAAEPEQIAILATEDGAVEFEADSFSIYVVGENDELYEEGGETRHYVYTVNFYIEDMSADPISSQTLSAGETIVVPGVPEVEHAIFAGWYSEPNGQGTHYDFTESQTLPAISEDTELDLFAHYNEAYYVYYMELSLEEQELTGSDDPVFHTEVYSFGDELDTSTATDLYREMGYLGATQAVIDWVDADGNSAPATVTDDIELYPVIENAYWIYFNVGEGMNTSVDPQWVLANETTIGELPDASCAGYSFDGWYTDENYTTQVTASTTLASLGLGEYMNDSVTLYAKWTPDQVAYTVNIWRQKATDGQTGIDQKTYTAGESYDDFIDYYDFAESYHVTADASTLYAGDSLADVTPNDRSSFLYSYTQYGTINDNESTYYGFEYATDRTQNNVRSITSVAADGNTVINIFYDRVTITWTFGSGNSARTLIGLYGTNCAQGDDPAGDYNDWTSAGNGNLWHYSSGGSSRNMTFEATFVILNSSASTTFTSNSVNTRSYGYYYLELTNDDQIDPDKQAEAESLGVPYQRTVNGTTYIYDRQVISTGGDFNLTDKYAGYKVAGYTTVDTGETDTSTSYTEAAEGDTIETSYTTGFIFQTTHYLDFYIFNDARTYTITLVSSDKNVGIADNGTLYDAGNDPTYSLILSFSKCRRRGMWRPHYRIVPTYPKPVNYGPTAL